MTHLRFTTPRGMVAGISGMMAIAMGAGALMVATPGIAQDAPGNKTSVEASSEGKELYEQICQACHMADAKGGAGAGTGVPALAGNAKMADKAFGIVTVYGGRGGMPRFAEMLTPAQIAAVLTYVRGHFNDVHDPVTEAEVKALANGPASKSDCNTCVH